MSDVLYVADMAAKLGMTEAAVRAAVQRDKSRGKVGERVRFTAWPPKPPEPPRDRTYRWEDHVHSPLGCFDEADAAKRCCEQHAGLLG